MLINRNQGSGLSQIRWPVSAGGRSWAAISLGTTLRAAHVPELLAAARVAATSALAPGSTASGVQGSSEWRLLVQETPGDIPQSCLEVTRGLSAGHTECCSFPAQ